MINTETLKLKGSDSTRESVQPKNMQSAPGKVSKFMGFIRHLKHISQKIEKTRNKCNHPSLLNLCNYHQLFTILILIEASVCDQELAHEYRRSRTVCIYTTLYS